MDCCESCGRIGSMFAATFGPTEQHDAATYKVCGYCLQDALRHGAEPFEVSA